jgi:hypothetical protein
MNFCEEKAKICGKMGESEILWKKLENAKI